MLWVAVGVVALLAVGGAVVLQRRHNTDLIAVLGPVTGQSVRLGVSSGTSQWAMIMPLVAVIESFDPRTRWVTFRSSLERLVAGEPVGRLSAHR